MRSPLTLDFLEPYRDYGAVFVRLIVGARLLYGTYDNVLSWEGMLGFAGFLERSGFPWPLLSANLSAWAQFVAGALFIAGAFVRPAALLMIGNFVIALLMVHLGSSFLDNFDALAMLFGSAFLLLNGAGALSVDRALQTAPGASPRAGEAPGSTVARG